MPLENFSKLENTDEKTEIVLLTYGKGDIDIGFMRTINLGFSKGEAEIAKFLSLGDLCHLDDTRETIGPTQLLKLFRVALRCTYKLVEDQG